MEMDGLRHFTHHVLGQPLPNIPAPHVTIWIRGRQIMAAAGHNRRAIFRTVRIALDQCLCWIILRPLDHSRCTGRTDHSVLQDSPAHLNGQKKGRIILVHFITSIYHYMYASLRILLQTATLLHPRDTIQRNCQNEDNTLDNILNGTVYTHQLEAVI